MFVTIDYIMAIIGGRKVNKAEIEILTNDLIHNIITFYLNAYHTNSDLSLFRSTISFSGHKSFKTIHLIY